MKSLFKRSKSYIADFAYTIGSTFVVSVMTQIVVFPVLALGLQSEQYGIMLSAIGVWEIVIAATGKELCNTRLIKKTENRTGDEPYAFIKVMVVLCIVCSIAVALFFRFALGGGLVDTFLMVLLGLVSTAKAYMFVRFRIAADFRGLFISNCLVSAGYVIGVALFGLTGIWPIVFIVAETLALVYTLHVTKVGVDKDSDVKVRDIVPTYSNLAASSVLGGLGSSFDRVSIPFILGPESLSAFFAASFFGKIVFFISTPLRTMIVTYTASGKLVMSRKTVALINVICIGSVFLFAGASWFLGDLITAFLYPSLYAEADAYIFASNVAMVLYLIFSVNMSLLLGNAPSWLQPAFSALRLLLYAVLAMGSALLLGLHGYIVGVMAANVAMGLISFAACMKFAR